MFSHSYSWAITDVLQIVNAISRHDTAVETRWRWRQVVSGCW